MFPYKDMQNNNISLSHLPIYGLFDQILNILLASFKSGCFI